MMRSRMVAVTLVVTAAAVAGCGGSSVSGELPESASRSIKQTQLSFSGPGVQGTVYVNAGQDELNGDLYRASGSFDGVERVTRDGRVSIIAASHDGQLAVSNARGAGSDRLELARVGQPDALPGTLIDSAGQAPSFSPGGKLLYSKPRYSASDGGDEGVAYYTTDSQGAGKQRVFAAAAGEDVLLDWGPDEQLAAVYDGKPSIVVDPGGAQERRISVPLESVTSFLVNGEGTIAALGPDHRVAVVAAQGEMKVFATRGAPVAWSPDGKSLLLLSDGTRLEVLTPADGEIRQVGRVENGQIYGAAWVPDGEE